MDLPTAGAAYQFRLLGPQADLEHHVDAARIELRLPFGPGLRRREQLQHRRLHRAHALRVVSRRLASGEVVLRLREWEMGVCAAVDEERRQVVAER